VVERTQFGKYRIVARIGQGAMGEVFKAHDPVLDRYVALKTIASTLGSNPEARQRFHREARSIARLNHPNIVTVYDFGEEAGEVYLAMELLEGTDLRELIAARRLGGLADRLALMGQVCEGVGFAHSLDVIHRDLKPANIHVQHSGHVKVMDFGLARIGASTMTQTGTVMGTPHYMSPEQVRGQKAVDSRSDVFALGAIFYELLTGHQPFEADSMHAVLYRILETEPEPIQRWMPHVPAPVAALAEKALAKDPAQRFVNAREMAAALKGARDATVTARADATVLVGPDEEETGRFPAPSRASSALEVRPAAAPRAEASAQPTGRETTLQGRAPTKPPAATRLGIEGRAPGPRRAALLAVALVAAAGGGAFLAQRFLRPTARPVPPTVASPAPPPESRAANADKAAVDAQRGLARQSLADRQLSAAATYAERVLEVQPDDPEALRIRDAARGSLKQADSVAAEGRAALARGDAATASRKLEELLSLDAGHPAVRDLTARLGSRLRAPMEPARPQAPVPPPSSRVASAAPVTSAPVTIPMPTPTPAVPLSVPTPPVTPPPVVVPTPAPTPVAVAPPVPRPEPTPVHTASVPSLPAPATHPPDDTAIRDLVASYARAIDTKDLGLYRRVKPNLSHEEERRLREAFQDGEQHVSIEILEIKIVADTARVRVLSRYTIDGKAQKPFEQLMSLRRGPSGWVVEDVKRASG
jgi:serine/threonine-protein kinase